MNPEFIRNVWLEMTPRRMALMVGVLALIFFASALGGSGWPSSIAVSLYYLIVVAWGSRSAALSVVGEMRDRTWDGQRLSSLSAGTMMWGKLFGSTVYNWFGGLICLALILVGTTVHQSPVAAVIELFYYIGIGIITQAAALLASLVAVSRRPSHSRFEIFIYQMTGISAAVLVYYIWSATDPAGSIIRHVAPVDFVTWWGAKIDARAFLLTSIGIFAVWTLIGCYRGMRLELKMRNGPLVWLAFLAFMGVYVAGFDDWLSPQMKTWDVVALRLLLAGTTFAALTYVMVLLEPKDRVHYRWMDSQVRQGHIGNALSGLQAWMMSYAAAFAAAVALSVWLVHDLQAALVGQPLVLAAMGFITRDVAIFVLMQTLPGKRRGDYAALAILFVLYVVAPAILAGLQAFEALFLFVPQLPSPTWLGVIAAWIQGVVAVGLVLTRLALTDREGKPISA